MTEMDERSASDRGGAGAEIDPRVLAVAGKYMTFKLADEEYGVEILKVRDINRLMKITRVPGTRAFIRGVINLRGKVIPVIDLRMKFGMGRIEETPWTVIIVVQYAFHGQDLTTGILVDEVLEVLDVPPRLIEPPPNFGTGTIDTGFILGVGKVGRRVVFLLDIGRVLSAEESQGLAGAVRADGETRSQDPAGMGV